MTFVGGGFALSPLAALCALGLCAGVTVATEFKYGARAGVFAFPSLQLIFDPVEHVAGTGALMSLIGVLFLRRSAPATPAADAAPRA